MLPTSAASQGGRLREAEQSAAEIMGHDVGWSKGHPPGV